MQYQPAQLVPMPDSMTADQYNQQQYQTQWLLYMWALCSQNYCDTV